MTLDAPIVPPRQKRSAETQARLLAAVARRLAAGDYADSTVQNIAAEAGCSIGAFYGRFKNKDAAALALYDAKCSALEGAAGCLLRDEAANLSLREVLARLAEIVVQHTVDNAPFIRSETFLTSRPGAAPFWERARKMNQLLIGWVQHTLLARRGEHAHPAPATAAMMVIALVGGLPRDGVKFGSRLVGEPGTFEGFKTEILRAVYGYLGPP